MFSVAFLVKNPPMDRLAALVEFLRPVANEFVIVDTGSTERELAVMRSWLGVRLIQIEWDHDFSAARNVGLEACTNEWTLVLDPDETPSLRMMGFLREILDANLADVAGYIFWTKNYWGGALGPEMNYHWHTRVFRTGRGKFFRPIHELVKIDDISELDLRGNPILPYCPKDAYLIHSKGDEDIKRADALYREMGEASR